MYKELDYESIEPIEIMNFLKLKKDKDRIDKILKLKIFKVRDWELIIPSFKCITIKNEWRETIQFKKFFPFPHQIFSFLLIEMKDLDFAISETKRILKWEKQYSFPNGNVVKLT